MGGNALKNVVTRRYARAEYYSLKERILEKLRGRIDEYGVPIEFPGKESFGDLDVLIARPASINMRNLIQDLFNPTEICHNGDVYSFDFEQFQIDFILVAKEYYQNAVVYFSYSDLGGLIGNICHKVGLKYGIQGLWMNIHTKEFDPTTTSTRLNLSVDVRTIFEFLGYDYQRYLNGFESETEFFEWISNGKYFQSRYFADDQLNHAHRQRTSKRPIYIKFRAFINQHLVLKEETDQIVQEQSDLISTVRQDALTFFNKQQEYNQGLNQRQERLMLKDKYSGHLFSDMNDGKQMIRVHMQNFEKRFGTNKDEFNRWVLNTDIEIIRFEIEKYKNEFKQQHLSEAS